jgi:hypothetical protein
MKITTNFSRNNRIKAQFLLLLIIVNTLAPTTSLFALSGGPSQPEVQSFEPAGTSQMVDLSTGSFTYNIPLFEIGGYPMNLAYHSSVTMDQEASCVGLGWNINPGAVNRNMRGLPDDFKRDSVIKEMNINANETFGIRGGLDFELFGFKSGKLLGKTGATLGVSLGVSFNNYKGVGFDFGISPSFSIGKPGKGYLTAGLGLSSSTYGGVDYNPSLSFTRIVTEKTDYRSYGNKSTLGIGLSGNTIQGLKGLNISASHREEIDPIGNGGGSSEINRGPSGALNFSFANPSYTPQFQLPYINGGFSVSIKGGVSFWGADPSASLTGFYSRNGLASNKETTPAFGYMYAQDGAKTSNGLMDFNRDWDGPFTENRTNLPVTVATQDIYSVSGQGVGGSYQLKRGDIGVVYDKFSLGMVDMNASVGGELGAGGLAKGGLDLNFVATSSVSGKWIGDNPMLDKLNFVDSVTNNPEYETAYLKNSGEKTVESDPSFIASIGGTEPVKVDLDNKVFVKTKNTLSNQYGTNVSTLNEPLKRNKREKRNQSISWLNANEASLFAHDKFIKNYVKNQFGEGNFTNIARTSDYRKKHHISEVTTLREDGIRYIYGLPAYNITQKEVAMSVNGANANCSTGLVTYDKGSNSIKNNEGPEHYFQSNTTPAYAHSYLLTSVISPDYVDVDNNGCSPNDIGNYTKFNYMTDTKAYKWRTPIGERTANYAPGLKSDKQDDKGNYIYGEKEVWQVHSMESKNEVARFYYSLRDDALGVADEDGKMSTQVKNLKLDKIEIYTKAGIGSTLSEPIKTIYFEYSYDLCKGLPNVVNATNGKLTLRKLYFTYGTSKKGKLSPYKFFYAGDNGVGLNAAYNLKGYDRWGNYKKNVATGQCGDLNMLQNADFPYTDQLLNQDNQNYSWAWTMNRIELPSGGEIKVEYESNDYAYVQDRRAMQMTKIMGFADEATQTNSEVMPNLSRLLYLSEEDAMVKADKNKLNETANRYIFFKLNRPLNGSDRNAFKDSIRDMYLGKMATEGYVYFKCLVALNKDTTQYEYVPGYAPIEPNSWGAVKSSSNVTGYDVGYLKLKPAYLEDDGEEGDTRLNVITKTAINFMKLNTPRIANNQPDPEKSDDWEKLGKAFSGLLDLFDGFMDRQLDDGKCRYVKPEQAWLRLNSPDYKKLGAGCRVKSIKMSDEWQTMAGGLNESYAYGQEYIYNTKEKINGIEKEISSGVASYEPMVGGDENPFKQPRFIHERHLWAPDDEFYIEEPIGESLFPGPSVIYSKVTVRNIKREDVKNTATGYSVSEYFTAKDFPTIVKETFLDGNSRIRKKSPEIFNALKIASWDFMTASQGYSIELNDMHGKPKAQWNYDEQGTQLSGVKYIYKTKDGKLDNKATVILPDGTVKNDAEIGVDYTMIADARDSETKISGMATDGNLDAFLAFIAPLAIPVVLPEMSTELTRFRSITTTKVIHKTALLEQVVAYEHGANIATENVAYDSETGDVLLTKSQNEFGDAHYSFTFPAHWAYEGMQAAYKSAGAVFKGNFTYDANGYVTIPSSGKDYFVFGDEVACMAANNSDVKAWVIDVRKATNQIKLVDRAGKLLSNTQFKRLKILRSGRKNLQSTPIAAVMTKSNVIQGNSLAFNNVVEASATEFSDDWQTGAEVAYYDGYYQVPSLDNPYTVGAKGNWRPMRSWSYLTDRKSENPDLASNKTANKTTDVRTDGVFNNFNSFWKKPLNSNEQWGIDSTKWTWSKKNTKIDGHGNQLESVDALGRYDARLMGYNNTLVTAIADNAKYSEISFDSYEDVYGGSYIDTVFNYNFYSGTAPTIFNEPFTWIYKGIPYTRNVNSIQQCVDYMNEIDPLGKWYVAKGINRIRGGVGAEEFVRNKNAIFSNDEWNYSSQTINDYGTITLFPDPIVFPDEPPTRTSSSPFFARENRSEAYDKPNAAGPTLGKIGSTFGIRLNNEKSHSGRYSIKLDTLEYGGNLFHNENNNKRRGGFNLKSGKYILSAWVHVDAAANETTFSDKAYIRININDKSYGFVSSGNIIDGWQRIYGEFEVPENVTYAKLTFGGVKAYFDDLRIHPFNANMKSFVYDPVTLRLVSELDENNYPTYYEYDKAGNLSHVKKVTEKGVQTVKEVRAGTIKNTKIAQTGN